MARPDTVNISLNTKALSYALFADQSHRIHTEPNFVPQALQSKRHSDE